MMYDSLNFYDSCSNLDKMKKKHCDIDIIEEKNFWSLLACRIQIITTLIIMFLTTTLGSVYLHFVWIPFIYIYQPLQMAMCELAIRIWFNFCIILLFALKTRFVFSGDLSSLPPRTLLIMNHRTMLDWLFYWCLVSKIGNASSLKIVLKKEFRNWPGFGWAPQMTAFIFLKRVWEKDKEYLQNILSYYTRSKKSYQLLMFPEGTNLHPLTVPRSNKFAHENNLPEYEYSLHPRATGFLYILDKLHPRTEQSHLDSIVDITIGFKGNIPLSPLVLISGYLPEEIHFHVKRYKMSEIPSSDVERDNWLREVWREKEERLKKFYEQDYSFGPEDRNLSEYSSLKKLLLILFWTSPFVITYFLWLYHPIILLGFFLLIPLFYYLQYSYDGLETLIASRYLRHFAK